MTQVSMTMGLVSEGNGSKRKPMLTYKAFPVGSNHGMAIMATSLDALRKKLCKQYPKGMYDIYRLYDQIGVYRNNGLNPEWWAQGGRQRWWEIDPKTGKIGVSDYSGKTNPATREPIYYWHYVNEKGEPIGRF